MAVDTACSSSLVVMHEAVADLQGEADLEVHGTRTEVGDTIEIAATAG